MPIDFFNNTRRRLLLICFYVCLLIHLYNFNGLQDTIANICPNIRIRTKCERLKLWKKGRNFIWFYWRKIRSVFDSQSEQKVNLVHALKMYTCIIWNWTWLWLISLVNAFAKYLHLHTSIVHWSFEFQNHFLITEAIRPIICPNLIRNLTKIKWKSNQKKFFIRTLTLEQN